MMIHRGMSVGWLGFVVAMMFPSLGETDGVASSSGERLAILTAVAADLRTPGLEPNAMAEWHVGTADVAGLELAHAMGVPVRVTAPGAPTTQCSRGYSVAVRYQLANPDLARVAVRFTCANPHRSARQNFAYARHYVVVRRAGGWSASVEGFEITARPSGLPNFSMQPTAFGRG